MKNGFRNPDGNTESGVTPLSITRYIVSRITKPPLRLGLDVPADFVVNRGELLKGLELHKAGGNVCTWLGHCAFLITIEGVTILTDPFLVGTAGPLFVRSLKRLPLPVEVAELPTIDVLLISHSHYDHLHSVSVKKLKQANKITQAIVPLGVGHRLKKLGVEKVHEMDWFEDFSINNLTITTLPANHYSTIFPKDRELWASYAIKVSNNNFDSAIYFSGDSGYGPFFKRDVAPHGPFDMSFFGIVNKVNSSRGQAARIHTDVTESIQAAQDINARSVIGMHWGTARMTDEDTQVLPDHFKQEADRLNYGGQILSPRIGETIFLNKFKT